MTYAQVVNTVIRQLESVFSKLPQPEGSASEYRLIACPERIFVDEYAIHERMYVERMAELPDVRCDDPNDTPYKNTVFVVVKLGGGQKNMAVTNHAVTLQVLSEENDLMFARSILDAFTSEFNFTFNDGILQAYFSPEVTSSQESVYTGFRALMSCRGFVRVPEEGFLFLSNIEATWDGDESPEDGRDIVFVSQQYHYSAQPDPQAFAGFAGMTKAMNRQGTETVSFNTYFSLGNDHHSAFIRRVLESKGTKLNANFRLVGVTNDPDVKLFDGWFRLVGLDYSQELADIAPVALSFAAAKEED